MREVDLNKYLADEEKKQLDRLLRKAAERKEKEVRSAGKNQAFQFQFCFECGAGERRAEVETKEKEEIKSPGIDMNEDLYDFEKLFLRICDFCKRNNLCPDCKKEQEEEEDDDDFPL